MYTEIVRLLSGGSLGDEAVREKAAELDAAVTDPEEWLLDYEPDEIRHLVVEMTLGEFFLIGDKIDELHELISDEFAESLPPFPYREDKEKVLVKDYFAWLDAELLARPTAWEVLSWHNGLDDNLHVVIVRRSDTDRLLALAGTMGLRVERATAI
ncbi:hypothetical protein DC429_15720 [Arthrobacter sp. TPD3018]|uniref:hypothetical protein n=1 Tax=Bacteria TaxID=2 RepID=UPI000D51E090|nr:MULTISPECIES: hypothetical protein [Bacteria]PVE52774.1 hypothetical protein DC425_15095 [Sphingomonas sp. TPD3009]PVE52961.1 hypothetical protein DC429_15720 [Arthrobacter sp. TPD3018]PVE81346.1 hypothetical protein DC431_15105 [Sphingomonas melonis]